MMAKAWMKRLPKGMYDVIAPLGKTRLVAGAIALITFCILCAITWARISFPFETDLLIWLQNNVTGLWGKLISLIYYAGDTESAGVITAIVLIYLLIKRWWQEGLWFAVATAGALVLVGEIFKPIFNKGRPPFVNDPSIHGAAFPSGHATGNTILYFFIAYFITTQLPHLGRRLYLLAAGWLILMGLGSMRIGAHWPTDILGGYCLGFLWLLVCMALLNASAHIPIVKKLPHAPASRR